MTTIPSPVGFARGVRADNPGPMTLEGTNSWLVRADGGWIVIDPGPLMEAHLDALVQASDGQVSSILLTHGHPDHAEGAARFAERVKAPVLAMQPGLGTDLLRDGQTIPIAGGSLSVLMTPGHTGDSTTFLAQVDNEAALFTGDTVLGRGTTVLIPPDGTLADYLASLERLEWMACELSHRDIPIALMPGHGPLHVDAVPVIAYYIDHRHERLEQVRAHLREGVVDPHELVNRIYADVPENVKAAALLSVQAQLDYLNRP